MTSSQRPPFAGKTFEVAYDGLVATNAYDADGRKLRYEVTAGPLRGAHGEAEYSWREIAPDVYAISWQEADGATVVHVDDFGKSTSLSFYVTSTNELHRLIGSLALIES